MNILEIRDVCNTIIKDGGGKSRVLFDTEAGTFDCHMVEIKELNYDKKLNYTIGENVSILYCDNKHISHK